MKFFSVIMSIGLALLFGSFSRAEDLSTRENEWRSKVAKKLLATSDNSSMDFLVVLAEQAEISPDPRRMGREVRITQVIDHLRATAVLSQAPLLEQLKSMGVAVQPFWIVNVLHVRGDQRALEAMARRDDVLRIDANPISPPATPAFVAPSSEAPRTVEWNIALVGADQVWAQGFDGSDVVVGSQDTGFFWEHPALKSSYRGWDGQAVTHARSWHDSIHDNTFAPPTCPANSLVACDDGLGFPHGTYTMGISVGEDGVDQIGVAPGAKWIGCRNADLLGSTVANYLECFQWLLAPTDLAGQNPDPSFAPHVINNSWGCIPSEGCNPETLETTVNNIRAAGIVVIAAAGNDGAACGTIAYPPALCEGAITVGATDSDDQIAAISSRGPVTIDGSNRMKPNLTAPGINVVSSIGILDIFGGGGLIYGYMANNGTSASAPHVAGAVALLLDARPDLVGQVGVIEALLEQSALPRTATQNCGGVPGSQVPNNVFGYGRLDAAKLVLGDADGDGTSTLVDCAPADATTWRRPSPALNLRLSGGAITGFSWSAPAQPGGSHLYYDLVRAGHAYNFGTATCIATNVSNRNAIDFNVPAPGTAFFYLVRAETDCGGDDESVVARACD